MAHFMKKALQLTPNQLLYQQKRYRGKINIKKPKIYYKKRVLNELLTPFFVNPNKDKTLEQFCVESQDVQVEKELGPYDQIIAREVRNWFDNSKMIGCLHVNSIKQLDVFDIRVALFRQNMHYKYYGPHIIKHVIKNSHYEALAPLVSRYTSFVFSPAINTIALQKIMKKSKKMFILGGVLEGQVLNYDDFLKYGEMDIVTTQLGLVQTLQNAGGLNLNRQFTHHQTTLVTRLGQIGTNETTSNDKK
ncbi:large ribosomal subunit protein uL10m isoform X1 [Bombus pascuorum]|uniref:large ribosomal subunit protein uL10m isoform X1 n=1 Tax=Bombus pascuorum TaxID=65598 RepID=UPI00298D7D17|nr:large ribosomal subunit protein uL10m isoform X1 [Bombus pascuorum]